MSLADESLADRFRRGGLVLDGATGTELERRGVRADLPLWSAASLETSADVVRAIHKDYVSAGADIVVANTFRTNPRTLQRAGRLADGAALNQRAVDLARQATWEPGHRVLLAASVAPAEDCYHPERVPAPAVLREEHARMADWLAAAGADLLWIETMGTSREAAAAAEAASARRLPFVVSFVVAENGDLLGGDPLEEAVAALDAYGPLAIGLNCIPPRGMSAILPRLRATTGRPLAGYAHINNAKPLRGWSYAQSQTPEQYAAAAREWIALGVGIVGGCCGTTPLHIRALRALLPRRGS